MRKFLVYIMTYVLMLFAGVGGVYIFSGGNTELKAEIVTQEPTVMDKMVANIMGAKSVDVDLDFAIDEKGTHLADISIDATVDMIDGFNQLALEGTIFIEKQDESFEIGITFIDNIVYISAFGLQGYAHINDLSELSWIVDLVMQKVLPGTNLTSMLDLSMLMDLMNGMEVNETETEVTLTIKTPLGNAVVLLDNDYNIKNVSLFKFSFNGIGISPQIGLTTSDQLKGIAIPTNNQEYANIAEELELLNALNSTLNADFAFDLNYDFVELVGSKSGANVACQLAIQDKILKISLCDNVVYFAFGDLKVKTDATDYEELIALIEDYAGIDLQSIDLMALLSGLLQGFDLSTLDLSTLMHYITKQDNIFRFVYDDFELTFVLNDGKLESVATTLNEKPLLVNFDYTEVEQVQTPQGDFLNARHVLTLVDSAKNTFTRNDVNIASQLLLEDKTINLNSHFAYENEKIYFDSTINYEEFEIKVHFVDDVFYVEYDDVKLKVNEKTLNLIKEILPLDQLNEEEIYAILSVLIEMIENTQIAFDSNNFSILNDGTITNIAIKEGKIAELDLNIDDVILKNQFSFQAFIKDVIVDEDYVEITHLTTLVENVLDFVQNDVYAQVNVIYDNLVVAGQVNFVANELTAQLIATYDNCQLGLTISDNVVYIDFKGAKLKFNINDIEAMLAFVESFGIELPSFDFDFNIVDILKLATTSNIAYTQDKLSLTYESLKVELSLENDTPNVLTVNYEDAVLTASLSNCGTAITAVEDEDYLDIMTMLPAVEAIYNTIGNNQFNGSLTLSMSVNNQLVTLPLDYNIKLTANGIVAKLATNLEGVAFEVYYENNVAYVAVDDICIKANINELDKVLEFVEEQFDLTIPAINVTLQEVLLGAVQVLAINDLSFVNSIVANDSEMSLNIGNLAVTLQFAEEIDYVYLTLNEIIVKTETFNNIALETTFNTTNETFAKKSGEYVDINALVDLAECAIATATSEALSGTISLTIPANTIEQVKEEVKVDLNFNYTYGNGNVEANISVNLLGNDLKLVYKNQTLYASYQGIKVYGTLAELQNYLPVMNLNFTKEEIIAVAVGVLKELTLSQNDNTTAIAYQGNELSLTTNGEIITNIVANTTYGKVEIALAEAQAFEAFTVTADYVQVDNVVELVDNVMALINGDIYVNVNATYEDITISGIVNYVAGEPRAELVATYQGYEATLTYIGETIYVDFYGAKLKFNIADTEEMLAFVAKFGVELPEMPQVSLDKEALLGLLSKVYVTYAETQFSIAYEDVVLNLALTNNNLTGLSVAYVGASVNASISSNGTAIAEVQAQDYVDVMTMLPAVEAIYNTIQSEQFNGSMTISMSVNNRALTLPLDYNVKLTENGIVAKLATTLEGVAVEVYYENGIVYVAVDDLLIKAQLNELDKVLAFVEEQFAVKVPAMNIGVKEIVGAMIEVLSIDDLSFVNTIVASDSEMSVTIGNLALAMQFSDKLNYAHITLNELVIENITLSNIVLEFTLNTQAQAFAKKSGEYVDITALVDLAECAIATATSEALSGTISLTIPANTIEQVKEEVKVDLNFNYTYGNGNIEANISVNLLGNELKLVYKNQTLYASYQGIKVYGTLAELQNYLPVMNLNFTKEEIIAVAVGVLKELTLSQNDNTTAIAYQGNELSLTTNGEIITNIVANTTYGKVEIALAEAQAFEAFTVTADYVQVDNVVELVENVMALINGDIYVELNATYEDITINGIVNYVAGEPRAKLVATYEGYEATLTYIGETIYVDCYGAKLKFNIADTEEMLAFVAKFGVELPEMPQVSLDKEALLGLLSKVYVTYAQTQLSIAYEDVVLNLALTNNNLTGLSVAYAGASVNASISSNGTAIAEIQANDYVDVMTMLPAVEAIYNTIQSEQFNGSMTISMSVNNQALTLPLDYNVKLTANGIVAKLATTLEGVVVEVYYENGIVYVAVDDIYVKVSIGNIASVLTFVEEQFKIALPKFDFKTEVIANAILNALSIDDLSFANTIVATQNSLSMQLGNLNVYFEFAETITFVHLTMNELAVENVTANNISIEATLNTAKTNITCKTGNYIDLNDFVTIVETALNTYQAEALSGQITATVPANTIEKIDEEIFVTFDYNYSYANGSIKIDLSTKILNDDLKIAYVAGNVYVAYQGVKLYARLSDIMAYLPKTDLKPTEQEIIAVAVSIIKDLTLTYQNSTFGLNYQGNELSITNNGEIITNIVANTSYGKVEMTIAEIEEYVDFAITNDFVYAQNLIELVENLIAKVQSNTAYATLQLNAFGLTLNGTVNYENGVIEAGASATILGKDLQIAYLENVVYIDFDGLKLKLAVEDFAEIMQLLAEYGLLNSSNDSKPSFGESQIEKLANAFYITYSQNQIVVTLDYDLADFGIDLTKIDLSKLKINLAKLQSGKASITANTAENQLNSVFVALAEDVTILATLQNAKQEISVSGNYIDITKFIPFVKEFANAYLSNGLSGQITVNVPAVAKLLGTITLNYSLNFNPLRLNLTTTLLNQEIAINIYQGEIFLDIAEMKYAFALSQIKEVASFISTNFLKTTLPSVGTNDMLNSVSFGDIGIEITSEKEMQISFKGVTLFVSIANGINIGVDYGDIDAQIIANKTTNNFVDTFENYQPIDNLLAKAKSIFDIVDSGKVQVQVQTTINEQLVDLTAEVDFATFLTTFDFNDLKVDAVATAFGLTVEVKLIEKVAYVSLNGLNIKLGLDDISSVMNLIKNHSVQMPATPSTELNSLIQSLSSTENSISAKLKDIASLDINFVGNNISNIVAKNLMNENLDATIYVNNKTQKLDIILAENYSNVTDLLPLCDKIWTIYESEALSLDATINGNILGHEQELVLSINVDFTEKLQLDVSLTFEGIDLSVHLRNNIFYVDIDGLKIKAGMSDIPTIINFANDKFGTELTVPEGIETKSPVAFALDLIKGASSGASAGDIDLSLISGWSTDENGLILSLSDGTIITANTDAIVKLGFTMAEYSGSLDVISIGEASKLTSITTENYNSVETYIDLLNSINNTLMTKQYKFVANAQVYKGNVKETDVNINASLSLIDGIFGGGTATVTGKQNLTVNVHYDNNYLYADYDGLKVKMNNDSMVEIVGIVLTLFGFDISTIPGFDNVDLDFNLDNMGAIMPNIDLGNPLTILNAIDSLSYSNNALTIGLDGKYLLNDENAKTMNLVFVSNGSKLTNIELSDIYSSAVDHANVQIQLADFAGLPTIEGTWHDISTISTLLKGVINTSELNDYHIVGNAYINVSLSFINIDIPVPVDIQIKLIDRKPAIMATLGTMPVIGLVNNFEGKSSPSDRLMTIYYYDGYIYFYVVEKVKNGVYEKKLKVALSTVLQDPMYYVQYMLGFTDTIIDAINEALAKSKNREQPMQMGKVLTGYEQKDGYDNITIDLGEIANNSDLKETTVGIKTTYNESAQKDYTTHLKFNMKMNFVGIVTMNVSTYKDSGASDDDSSLRLVDIGQEVSLTACSAAENAYAGYVKDLFTFVETYTYAENEEWDAENGDWKKASEREFTLSFSTPYGTTPSSITGKMNTAITLPTFTTVTVDEGTCRNTYQFAGWYTTDKFTEGTEFTQTTMPRGNKTLYAKWNLIQTLTTQTITFNTQGGNAVVSQKHLAGSKVDLSSTIPTRDTHYVDKGYKALKAKWEYQVTRYTFAGWYTDSSCTTSFSGIMPSSDITLYAKWTSSTTTEYYYAWERP